MAVGEGLLAPRMIIASSYECLTPFTSLRVLSHLILRTVLCCDNHFTDEETKVPKITEPEYEVKLSGFQGHA